MRPLEGKAALVTGGSRGVGKAVAIELAESGANVAVTARTVIPRGDDLAGTVADTAAAIEAAGGKALAIGADLLVPGEVDRVVPSVLAAFGRIDILVNNAADTGDNVFRGFWETTPAEWDAQIQLNVNVFYAMMKACAPSMKENGGGLVINMGSMSAVAPGLQPELGNGLKLGAAYPTSKVAIFTMSTLLARELAEDGIVVCTVNPGGAASEMHYHHMARLGIAANPTPLALPAKTIGHIATCEDPMSFAATFVDSVSFARDNGLVNE
jgi:NAD(P)-dependent dehydrogenase (short-subunit alcohol dehydrogenase family)